MKPKMLFREEVDGFYMFNREDGEAELLSNEDFDKKSIELENKNESFDIIKKPKEISDIALTAPNAIWHETTQSCNLNCEHCGHEKTSEDDIELSQIQKIYKDLASAGVFEIRLTGGEACQRSDIDDIVLSAKDNGFFVSLTTNAVYNDALREKIVNLPIGLYIISLEGTQEINDEIRRGGSYSKAMKTIRKLTNLEKNVRVNTVLMRKNKDCIEDFVGELDDAGVKALTLIPLRPVGMAKKDFFEKKLSPREYMGFVEHLNTIREKHPGFTIETAYDILPSKARHSNVPKYWDRMCLAGIGAGSISPSGNLRACILHQGEDYNVGNLLENPFKELWHNDELWGIFRDMERRVLDQCKTCEDYTVKCPGSCLAMTEYLKKNNLTPFEMYCHKHLMANSNC